MTVYVDPYWDRFTWQPIETAPRDGSEFLAVVEVKNLYGLRWHERRVIWVDEETGDLSEDCDFGWSLDDYTHWMPLPDAPTT